MMDFIRVSAQNSTDLAKESSDYICTGKNDEKIMQDAIEACMEQNKNLYFFNGIYHIDAFYDFGDQGPRTALRFPKQPCRLFGICVKIRLLSTGTQFFIAVRNRPQFFQHGIRS